MELKGMKLKVLTVLSLSAALALSGCSSAKPGSGDSAANVSDKKEQNTDAPAQLSWFADASFWNPPSPWSTDPNTVEGAITKKTGLTFDFTIPPQDPGTKLSLMLTTGDKLPDIITLTDGNMEKKLIDSGKVWKLDEFFSKYDPSSTFVSNFPKDVKDAQIERDGGWYAVPSHIDSKDLREKYPASSEVFSDAANYATNNTIMFNEQIMKQAGISLDDLKTEDGLLAALEKVKSLKVNGAPVIPLQTGGKVFQSDTLPTLKGFFGAMEIDKDGNYRDIMFAPETKHALEFMNKAFRNGYFDPNQFTMDNSGVQAAILSGRVFAFIGNVANTKFDDVSSNNTWVSPGPILSNQNTKPVWGKYQKTGTGWMQTYISKTASNPERIAQFIDFMESNEGQMLWSFGFEGKDYTLENGLVHKTEQGVKDAGDWTKTGVGAFWEFANLAWADHVTPAPTAETNPKALMAIKVHTAAGKASVMYDTSALAMPSDFFPAGSKEANDQVQIATYTEAQVTKVILSKNDDAFNQSYNDMINQLKQLGLTEIDAKINEQFHKQEQAMGESIKGINS